MSESTSRRGWIGALTSAVLIALLAGGIAVLISRSTNSEAQTDLTGLRGMTWRLTEVVTGSDRYPAAAKAAATISFGRDGSVVAGDTVNAVSGTYTVDGDVITTRDAVSTLVGFVATDPGRKAVIDGIDSIFQNDTDNAPVRSTSSIAGKTLTLTTGRFTMTFVLVGPYVEPSMPSSTPSAADPIAPFSGSEAPS